MTDPRWAELDMRGEQPDQLLNPEVWNS